MTKTLVRALVDWPIQLQEVHAEAMNSTPRCSVCLVDTNCKCPHMPPHSPIFPHRVSNSILCHLIPLGNSSRCQKACPQWHIVAQQLTSPRNLQRPAPCAGILRYNQKLHISFGRWQNVAKVIKSDQKCVWWLMFFFSNHFVFESRGQWEGVWYHGWVAAWLVGCLAMFGWGHILFRSLQGWFELELVIDYTPLFFIMAWLRNAYGDWFWVSARCGRLYWYFTGWHEGPLTPFCGQCGVFRIAYWRVYRDFDDFTSGVFECYLPEGELPPL